MSTPVDVLTVMDLAADICGQASFNANANALIEARATVAGLIEALQHIKDFTAYQDCDICNDMHNVAGAALAQVQP